MADAFSLASSIIGVASAGIKLSTTLYHFTESAIHADRHVKDIARDLSITSSVITRFGTLLGEQTGGNLGGLHTDNENIIKTARDAVNGCDEVFKEIQRELDKYVGVDEDEDERRPMVNALRRLKWPLVQPKFIALHARLERLKNTLVLTLNVVSYASRTSLTELEAPIVGWTEDQRRQIDRLILMNEEANARYRALEKALQRIESMHEGTASPFRTDSGVQFSKAGESSTSGMNHDFARPVLQPSKRSSARNSFVCVTNQEAFPRGPDAFRLTREDLSTCADQARLFLKVVEEAQSSNAEASRCEEVRKAYFESLQSLQSIFPPQQQSEEPQQKPSRLRRLFSKRLRNS